MPITVSRKKVIVFISGLCVLTGVFLLAVSTYYLITPAQEGIPDQIFFVEDGSTLRQVADELEKKEIIRSRNLFLVWTRFLGHARHIKAGEYRLNPGMSPLDILETLSSGAIVTHPVTIPEGYSRMQIAELLAAKGLVGKDEFLALTGDPDVATHYGIAGPDLEGYLYPDTYQFSRGFSAASIIDVMVRHFRKVTEHFRDHVKTSGMTLEQIVILASIVEKETGRAEERPMIASVFLNRLKKGNRLESDPTVIYGIKDFDGNLKKKDLIRHSPYNTYVIRGLPPGAIANPGKEAIKAVLFPADTSYMYFVSKNDGSHHFSETLAEHNRAVRIYQKNRRSRQRAKNL